MFTLVASMVIYVLSFYQFILWEKCQKTLGREYDSTFIKEYLSYLQI